jgi:hypothetical protein
MHYDCDIRGEHVMRIPVDGTIVYVRGDMLVKFARKLEQINKYRKRFVLISHQSDLSVPSVNGGKLSTSFSELIGMEYCS